MTSFRNLEAVRCAICGKQSPQVVLASSSASSGAPDFDTRPGEMLRSTIPHWLLECPHCRYSAPDIAQSAPAGAAEIVSGEPYQALGCKFQRHSLLLERLGHYAEAGWVSLHAAWVADDGEDDATARRCRAKAIDLWKRGKQRGQSFADTIEQEFGLAVDLLRRLGRFEEARQTCMEALNEPQLTPRMEDLLRMQLTLIGRRDATRHGMDELPVRPEGAQRLELS
jgi:hypothetical protein